MRRQRAQARLAWHLHRRGFRRLSTSQLRVLLHRLRCHHSKDLNFIRIITAEMSKQAQQGWLCGNCRKMKSPAAWFCDLCGQKWEDCAIPTSSQRSNSRGRQTYAQGGTDATPWTGQEWPKSPRQSPRHGKANKPKRSQSASKGGGRKDRKGRRRGKARERCLWLRHHRRPSADRTRLLLHGHRCPCLPAPHSRRENLQRNKGSARFWDFSTSRTQTL